MATVINNPSDGSGSAAAGWAVAVVILAGVILIGLFVWPGYARPVQEPAGINVDVNLPTTGGEQGGADTGGTQ
jgi:hypothetical protein